MSNIGNGSYRGRGYGGNNQNRNPRNNFRNRGFNNNKYNKSNSFYNCQGNGNGGTADMQFYKFKDPNQSKNNRGMPHFDNNRRNSENRYRNKKWLHNKDGNVVVGVDAQEQQNYEISVQNTSSTVKSYNIEVEPTIIQNDIKNTLTEILTPEKIKMEHIKKQSLCDENTSKEKGSSEFNPSIKKNSSEAKNKSSKRSSDSSSDSGSGPSKKSKNKVESTSTPSSKAQLQKIKSAAKLKSPEVECLGELNRNFSIDDNDSQCEYQDVGKLNSNNCIICDNKDHTSFQCQMICKNCSKPFHNLKTCPKPANVNVMLQSFMEFCMQQLNNYNSEQRFQLPPNVFHCNGTLNTPIMHLPADASKVLKRFHSKAKKVSKKKVQIDSSESEDGKQKEKNTGSDETSTDSSSSEMPIVQSSNGNKLKRKRRSDFNQAQLQYALQYNPLMYNQMLQNPFPNTMNFNC